MAVYKFHTIIFSITILLVILRTVNGEQQTQAIEQDNKPRQSIQKKDSVSDVIDQSNHVRVKRQFGFGYPYPYYGGFYRRPIPIIVGGFGFGIGPRSFDGFGPRGFGGRGFGGRGFGGRGFGGFGGRGFGGGRGGRG